MHYRGVRASVGRWVLSDVSAHIRPAVVVDRTPVIRRVPAWTVAVSEYSLPDYVFVMRDPDTGRAMTYEESLERWPQSWDAPRPVLMHRLTPVEINAS